MMTMTPSVSNKVSLQYEVAIVPHPAESRVSPLSPSEWRYPPGAWAPSQMRRHGFCSRARGLGAAVKHMKMLFPSLCSGLGANAQEPLDYFSHTYLIDGMVHLGLRVCCELSRDQLSSLASLTQRKSSRLTCTLKVANVRAHGPVFPNVYLQHFAPASLAESSSPRRART